MKTENNVVSGLASECGERDRVADCEPQFEGEGLDAGGRVKRAGTQKDWRGDQKKSGSSKGPKRKPQGELADPGPKGLTRRGGAQKDRRKRTTD